MSKNHENPLYLVQWKDDLSYSWVEKCNLYAKLACENFWSKTFQIALNEIEKEGNNDPFVYSVNSFAVIISKNMPIAFYGVQFEKNGETKVLNPEVDDIASVLFWNEKLRKTLQTEINWHKKPIRNETSPIYNGKQKKILQFLKNKI